MQKGISLGQSIEQYFSPEIKYKDEIISNQANWEVADSLILFSVPSSVARHEFNETGDTLIGLIRHRDLSCLNLPQNEEIAIPISKLVDGERYLGWIIIRLSGENTIEILETAIQKH